MLARWSLSFKWQLKWIPQWHAFRRNTLDQRNVVSAVSLAGNIVSRYSPCDPNGCTQSNRKKVPHGGVGRPGM